MEQKADEYARIQVDGRKEWRIANQVRREFEEFCFLSYIKWNAARVSFDMNAAATMNG